MLPCTINSCLVKEQQFASSNFKFILANFPVDIF